MFEEKEKFFEFLSNLRWHWVDSKKRINEALISLLDDANQIEISFFIFSFFLLISALCHLQKCDHRIILRLSNSKYIINQILIPVHFYDINIDLI